MARRKTISPRDEYGNSFVTYSNPPAVAPLSQPSLQQEKQAEQSQILKQRDFSGGDVGEGPGPAADPTGFMNADNPNSPNSEGDNAAKSAQTLNTVANALSAVSVFAPMATPFGIAARSKSMDLTYSRESKSFVKGFEDDVKSFIGIPSISARNNQAMIEAFINEEPEEAFMTAKGKNTKGKARGWGKGFGDSGDGGLGAGLGESDDANNPDSPNFGGVGNGSGPGGATGIGGDPSDAPGSGDNSEGIP